MAAMLLGLNVVKKENFYIMYRICTCSNFSNFILLQYVNIFIGLGNSLLNQVIDVSRYFFKKWKLMRITGFINNMYTAIKRVVEGL